MNYIDRKIRYSKNFTNARGEGRKLSSLLTHKTRNRGHYFIRMRQWILCTFSFLLSRRQANCQVRMHAVLTLFSNTLNYGSLLNTANVNSVVHTSKSCCHRTEMEEKMRIISCVVSARTLQTKRVFLDARISQLLNGYFLLNKHHRLYFLSGYLKAAIILFTL